MFFQNRTSAGIALAEALGKYQGKEVIVYALPRGGVVTAIEVARHLHAPIDLIITRKIGHPVQHEYAIAAIAEDGDMVANPSEVDAVDEEWLKLQIRKERKEAKRRRELYLRDIPKTEAKGKIAILVDDGVATGLTMRAGIKELRHRDPAKIVVAVPVVGKRTANILQQEADELVALDIPSDSEFLGAVGAYYEDFLPVENGEVISRLASYANEYAITSRHLKHVPVLVDPLLYAFPEYQPMVDELTKVPGVNVGTYNVKCFANCELEIELSRFRPDTDCYVLGSIAPPDEQLLSFLLLSHTLTKELARSVTGILPYLGYTRQDVNQPRKSFATALMGRLFEAAGLDEVITVDVHSQESKRLFPMHLTSLSPAGIFAEELWKAGLDEATIVAPDHGAIERAKAVARKLGHDREIAYMTKERTSLGIVHRALHGTVGKQAVIVDDILDTGATLISCAENLRRKGVESIVIMVTHGLFSNNMWNKLWEIGVDYLYCTDSVPLPNHVQHERIKVLSIVPLLVEKLHELQLTAVTEEELEEIEHE